MFKIDVRTFGDDYRVATLFKSYLTIKGIAMQKRQDNSNKPKLTKRAIRYGRTDPNYRKASLLKSFLGNMKKQGW